MREGIRGKGSVRMKIGLSTRVRVIRATSLHGSSNAVSGGVDS